MRQLGSFLPGTGLGGAGVHWNGQTWRFHPRDFTTYTSTVERYGKAAIPAGMTHPGLGHHLRRARAVLRQVRVHGRDRRQGRATSRARSSRAATCSRGRARASSRSSRRRDTEVERAVPEGDATSSATTRSSRRPRTCRSPTRTPTGSSAGSCTYCGFCERFGCEVGAKADPTVDRDPGGAQDRQVRDQRLRERVRDPQRRQDRPERPLLRRRSGQVQEQPADIIVLAAYVFNNVRTAPDLEARQAVRPGHETRAPSEATTPTRQAAAGRAAGSTTSDSTATWARVRTPSRSTTSTPITSTTPASASSAAARSRPGRAARGRSRACRCRPGTPRRSEGSGRRPSRSTTTSVISVGFQGESPAYQTHLPRSRPELPRQLRQPAGPDYVRLAAERAEDDRVRGDEDRSRS